MPVSRTSSRTVTSASVDLRERRGNHDFAVFGELDRVAGEIDEHLPQAVGVAAQAVGDVRVHVVGKLQRFFFGRGASISAVSATSATRSKSTSTSSSLPASILEKSSVSLIKANSASLDDSARRA